MHGTMKIKLKKKEAKNDPSKDFAIRSGTGTDQSSYIIIIIIII